MKVTKYILYCSNCNPSRWVEIKPLYQAIEIIVDLKTDRYIFKSICPHCKNKIKNTRKAF